MNEKIFHYKSFFFGVSSWHDRWCVRVSLFVRHFPVKPPFNLFSMVAEMRDGICPLLAIFQHWIYHFIESCSSCFFFHFVDSMLFRWLWRAIRKKFLIFRSIVPIRFDEVEWKRKLNLRTQSNRIDCVNLIHSVNKWSIRFELNASPSYINRMRK